MLNSKEIIEIITYVNGSTVDEVHYEHESFVVKVKNQNPNGESNNQDSSTEQVPNIVKERGQEDIASEPVKTTLEEESKTHTVTSPMVGMFYASPSPDDAVFVNVGDYVSEDTVVCVLEAMKMFNDVQADVNGEIIDILVQNGDLVEFGQPLFKVKAE